MKMALRQKTRTKIVVQKPKKKKRKPQRRNAPTSKAETNERDETFKTSLLIYADSNQRTDV